MDKSDLNLPFSSPTELTSCLLNDRSGSVCLWLLLPSHRPILKKNKNWNPFVERGSKSERKNNWVVPSTVVWNDFGFSTLSRLTVLKPLQSLPGSLRVSLFDSYSFQAHVKICLVICSIRYTVCMFLLHPHSAITNLCRMHALHRVCKEVAVLEGWVDWCLFFIPNYCHISSLHAKYWDKLLVRVTYLIGWTKSPNSLLNVCSLPPFVSLLLRSTAFHGPVIDLQGVVLIGQNWTWSG